MKSLNRRGSKRYPHKLTVSNWFWKTLLLNSRDELLETRTKQSLIRRRRSHSRTPWVHPCERCPAKPSDDSRHNLRDSTLSAWLC